MPYYLFIYLFTYLASSSSSILTATAWWVQSSVHFFYTDEATGFQCVTCMHTKNLHEDRFLYYTGENVFVWSKQIQGHILFQGYSLYRSHIFNLCYFDIENSTYSDSSKYSNYTTNHITRSDQQIKQMIDWMIYLICVHYTSLNFTHAFSFRLVTLDVTICVRKAPGPVTIVYTLCICIGTTKIQNDLL